jgi:hypothetical protein
MLRKVVAVVIAVVLAFYSHHTFTTITEHHIAILPASNELKR